MRRTKKPIAICDTDPGTDSDTGAHGLWECRQAETIGLTIAGTMRARCLAA